MKLSNKIGSFLLVFSLIATIIISLTIRQLISSNYVKIVSANQSRIAATKMDQIDRILYQKMLDIENIAQSPYIINNLKNTNLHQQNKEHMKSQLNHYNVHTGPWDSLLVVDKNKNIIFSSNNKDNRIINLQKQKAFNESFKNRTIYSSDIILSNETGKKTVFFSAPIKDESSNNNQIIGVVIGELSWQIIKESLDDLDIKASLYDENNFLITENKSEYTINDSGIISTVNQLGYLDYKGHKWKLQLFTPENIAFKDLNKILLSNNIIGILSFLAIIIVLLIIMERFIVAPIKKLTIVSQKISNGDLSQNLQIKSNDEIGELASSLNQMTKTLIDQKENINKIVKKRTEQLSKLNKFMVGRELEMADLKKEIAKLKNSNNNKNGNEPQK